MATKAKPTKDEYTEFERLTRYRFDALRELGLTAEQAIALVETADVVHDAQALADRGCPPAIIASLLGK